MLVAFKLQQNSILYFPEEELYFNENNIPQNGFVLFCC